MDLTIAKLKKTSKAELWISLRRYRGKNFIDLREHFLADDRQWHPTRKGIMIASSLLANVIDGVDRLREATELGTVTVIQRSMRDEIQVGLREYDRHRYGDVRVWYDAEGGVRKPSGKGATFQLRLADSLLDALRAAEHECEKRAATAEVDR